MDGHMDDTIKRWHGLPFATRKVGVVTIIDWSLAGGSGCGPANPSEVAMLKRIAELEAALRAIVDFNDGPTERKRPDIYSLLLMRARNVLDASKTEGR